MDALFFLWVWRLSADEGRHGMMVIQRNVRKIVTGAVGALMLILTLGSALSVGASAPTNVFVANACPVGNYQCLGYGNPYYYGAAPSVGAPYVYAHYNAVPGAISYFDPRYCGDGRVSIVSDKDGNLINACTSTGVRIFPIYGDGYPYGVAPYVVYR
jgi:hypothetical protein